MADVKDVLEVVAFLKKVGETVVDVTADGKVNILDLPKLAPLWAPARDAMEGLQNALVQIKDIDAAEAKVLLLAVVDLAQAWAPVFGVQLKARIGAAA